MKIEQNIAGQDAIRLADCIKFASKEGLEITKYTQCGINENSGNVWLWDEDWLGCIYQDMGFSGPNVSWSCPNCGNEFYLEKMADCEPLSEYFNNNDGCEYCQPAKEVL